MRSGLRLWAVGALAILPAGAAVYAQQDLPAASPLPAAASPVAPASPPGDSPAPAPVSVTVKMPVVIKNTPAAKPKAKARPAKPQPRFTMDFRDTPIDQILNKFSTLSGLALIKDPGLQGTATFIMSRPTTLNDAYTVLAALLESRGYRLERTSTMMRVLSNTDGPGGMALASGRFGGANGGGGFGPGGGGPGGFNGGSGGGPGGGFAAGGVGFPGGGGGFPGRGRNQDQTEVYKLQYASAKSIATIVNDLFKNAASGGSGNTNSGAQNGNFPGGNRGFPGGPGGPGGFPGGGGFPNQQNQGQQNGGNNAAAASANATPAAPSLSTARATSDDYSNSVIITGPPDQLSQVRAVIQQIDKPVGSTQITQIFPLKYVSVTEMATVVSNVLAASQTSGAGAGSGSRMSSDQRGFMSAISGASAASGGQVVASTESNSLIVTASETSLDLVQQILKQLDQPIKTQSTTYVRQLQNASATEVAQILTQLYGTRSGTSTATTTGTSSNRLSQNGTSSRTGQTNGLGNTSTNTLRGGTATF